MFFVGLDRIGKFTFIEEKTVIKPPELPTMPESVREETKPDKKTLLIGVCVAIAGLLLISVQLLIAIIALVIGIIMICSFATECNELKSAKEHNKKVEEEVTDWVKAWNEWEDTVFITSYLADTDDVIGRVHTAFHETVEQVSQEFFFNQPEQISVDKASQTDLRQAIEKRRTSFR